ncbi:hypothetical protein CALVIDRAFT_562598 [Calocera viscosa TUFC12733]|uniref:Uncharacterized protein n=1 Tax=Calocera viscosa (strain TUFC12733) TaxID=1330018 RepID=A0A167NGV7_CALVF|nr:hypothetical protein CALVIDRAFT_562598 [Calocera viscosa TUFC12733]
MRLNTLEVYIEIDGCRVGELKPTVADLADNGQRRASCYIVADQGRTLSVWAKCLGAGTNSDEPTSYLFTVPVDCGPAPKFYDTGTRLVTLSNRPTLLGTRKTDVPAPTVFQKMFFTGWFSSPIDPQAFKIETSLIPITFTRIYAGSTLHSQQNTSTAQYDDGTDETQSADEDVWTQNGEECNFIFYYAPFNDLQRAGILPSTDLLYAEYERLKASLELQTHKEMALSLKHAQREATLLKMWLTSEKEKVKLIQDNIAWFEKKAVVEKNVELLTGMESLA